MPREKEPGRKGRTQRQLDEVMVTSSKPCHFLWELRILDEAFNRLNGRRSISDEEFAKLRPSGFVATIPLRNLIPKQPINQKPKEEFMNCNRNDKELLLANLAYYTPQDCQSASGLSILPITRLDEAYLDYISLHEALKTNSLQITEISEGGSVPNLKVKNLGSKPVLILEGEELRGAKQNRVLNTSVLIGAMTTETIPVSCTERGRWSYESRNFKESGNVLSPLQKAQLKYDVVFQLAETGEHRSDQSRIWNDIDKMQQDHGHRSQTSAMADVYEHHGDSLNEILSQFPCLESQCGIYARIDGRFAGFDLVSKPEVWTDLHAKIIRSYAMEVLNRNLKTCRAKPGDWDRLVSRLSQANYKTYEVTGKGFDVRFDTPNLIGSALLWYSEAVHVAAYPKQTNRQTEEPYHNPRYR